MESTETPVFISPPIYRDEETHKKGFRSHLKIGPLILKCSLEIVLSPTRSVIERRPLLSEFKVTVMPMERDVEVYT
jgi:hypothetical protein